MVNKDQGPALTPKLNSVSGFTLIEILVVIGLIAVLAGVVLVAVNPSRQFAQGRDSQRNSNLNALLNAIGQKIADSKGVFATGCPVLPGPALADAKVVDSAGGGGGIDLSCLVPTYIPALPTDPSGVAAPSTGYKVYQDGNGRVHVLAETQEPSIPRTAAIEIVR